jgi:RNA polymerase sigma factor (sigma-70 family)
MSDIPTIPFPDGSDPTIVYSSGPARHSASGPKTDDDARAELRTLVVKAQSGDLDAQSALVRRYTKRLAAFIRPIISQPSAVDDVVQLSLIKMVRQLERLRDPMTFESWLFTLSRNTSLDFIRRRRCRPVAITDNFDFGKLPDPSSTHALREIEEALERALERLSRKDRNLVKSVVQGSTYRAAAKREGLTIGAVKVRLNRVRPFLRLSVGQAIGLPVVVPANFQLPPRCRPAA